MTEPAKRRSSHDEEVAIPGRAVHDRRAAALEEAAVPEAEAAAAAAATATQRRPAWEATSLAT